MDTTRDGVESEEVGGEMSNMSLEGTFESKQEKMGENSKPDDFLEQFSLLVSQLQSLNLLHFFTDHAVADIVQTKVRFS